MNKNMVFASDNTCHVHPDAVQAIMESLSQTDYSYGNDSLSHECKKLFKETFGNNTTTFFLGTGTAANICALGHLLKPTHAVICTDIGHINTSECGAFEKHVGAKIFSIQHKNGKLDLEKAASLIQNQSPIHKNKIKAISISQTTEVGTVYTIEELRQIKRLCEQFDLFFHVDGARLFNAAVSLNASFKQITKDVGIDVLSFGGTKNGLLMAESVIFFDEKNAIDFEYIQKQNLQLFSKMRFIPAQYNAFLKNDLWKKNAENANKMAQYFSEKIAKIKQIKIAYPVESNMLFLEMPLNLYEELTKNFYVYLIDKNEEKKTGIVRFITNFATSKSEIDNLIISIEKKK